MISPGDTAPRSWIDVDPGSDFPIQNLPFGVFRRAADEKPQVGVRISDFVLDLKALEHAGFFRDTALGDEHYFCKWALNKFMAAGREVWHAARTRIADLLRHDNPRLRDDRELRRRALLPVESVEMLLPAEIGGFVDFYASKEHATNVGIMFRGPENALMPNWVHMPIAYNGRAGSIIPSGVDFHRPLGQTKADDAPQPAFGPSKALDFELEMGFFAGPANPLGTPISTAAAPAHIFGMVLLNDWSARDIQRWEYQPLGPFLGKSFATSISPWVVAMDALEPFRVAAPPQEPQVLPYLRADGQWAYDIRLEVLLQSAQMRQRAVSPVRITSTNLRGMYWTLPQMIAHMTSNGCNIRPGDLFGTGTVSGPAEDSRGSMLELTWKGTKPLQLPTGETRKFLEDGDKVILRGWCEGKDYRIGFGECAATVLPAAAALPAATVLPAATEPPATAPR